jgi:cell division protease FtsH
MIDAEVKRITDEAYENAKRILKQNMDGLHKLASELLDKETLTGEQVRNILGVKKKVE